MQLSTLLLNWATAYAVGVCLYTILLFATVAAMARRMLGRFTTSPDLVFAVAVIGFIAFVVAGALWPARRRAPSNESRRHKSLPEPTGVR